VSNNSCVLKRDECTKEEFDQIFKSIEGFGEPGFYFVDDYEEVTNPCFTGDTLLLTSEGKISFKDLCDKENIELINPKGEIHSGKVWSNGVKDIIQLTLTNGETIKCTPNHVFKDIDDNSVEAKDLKSKKIKHFSYELPHDLKFVKLGFIQGDGVLSRLDSETHKGLEINIGDKDREIVDLFELTYERGKRSYYTTEYTKDLLDLGFSSSTLETRILPISYNTWTFKKRRAFLAGLFSANGCVVKNSRIAFKSICKELIDQLKSSLLEFGIESYITTNKAKDVLFSNGTYTCKESYDLNIASFKSMLLFNNIIGFYHSYKKESLIQLLTDKTPSVRSIKSLPAEEVFDFTINDSDHWGIVGESGLIAHNCVEIGFYCYTEDGRSGWQMCNLTTINGGRIKDEQTLIRACTASAILGTLQAGYTNFKYLGEASKEIIEREALLGCSITGWMDSPYMLTEEAMLLGSNTIKEINKVVSSLISINQAARCTCVKFCATN